MKTREQIQEERQKYIESRQLALRRKVQTTQALLYSSLFAIITGLDTDENGKIKFSITNITKTAAINAVFQSNAVKSRNGVVRWIAKGLINLIGLNSTYFKTIQEYSYEAVDNAAVNLVMKALGFDVKEDSVIGGSWLDGLAAANDTKQQVFQRINTAISANMNLSDFKKAFRNDFLDNNTGLGLLSKHYETHTGNIYASVDRQTQNVYRQKLGLNHAVYAGTAKDNTRDFCLPRINHVYTLEEINKWNNLDWKGKIDGGDVKVTLGGFNCRHQLNWVTEPIAKNIAAKTGGINAYS